MSEPFLTTTEVAALLKLNVETIYDLIAKEGLPAAKVGGQWRFQESRIRAWVEARYASHERTPAMPRRAKMGLRSRGAHSRP
jgi:excisionase family DNA binding protein